MKATITNEYRWILIEDERAASTMEGYTEKLGREIAEDVESLAMNRVVAVVAGMRGSPPATRDRVTLMRRAWLGVLEATFPTTAGVRLRVGVVESELSAADRARDGKLDAVLADRTGGAKGAQASKAGASGPISGGAK